jgi:ABC-2 type transport system permease protein
MISRNSLFIAGRVFRELRRDVRTMFLFVLSPTLIIILLKGMMNHNPDFDRYALLIVGLFPTAPAFLFTAFALTRDRNRKTLEHLLTTPVTKPDIIAGYIIAFILPAVIQVSISISVTFGLLHLHVAGKWWEIGLLAFLNCILGISIGAFATNLARNEFQLTKVLLVVGVPQIILSGFFRPTDRMVGWMRLLSHIAPWRYGIGVLSQFQHNAGFTAIAWDNLIVVVLILFLLFSISAFTVLRRRTA